MFCPKCKKYKPISCFTRNKGRPRKHNSWCTNCTHEDSKKRRLKLITNGLCVSMCGRKAIYGNTRCKKCTINRSESARLALIKRKEIIINHYTRNTHKCSCVHCKETNIRFLTIDHKNNDGKKDRLKFNINQFYKYIIDNKFPKIYQILCMNCNWGRYYNGGVCPHINEN